MKDDLTIHILWEFTDNPWGGGNQFLKAVRNEFIRRGVYSDDPTIADVILFNSHQFQKQALKLKQKLPGTIFIHRVDGPIAWSRGNDGIQTDRKIFFCNDLIADGTVFQSTWSREESYRQGMKKNRFETCIINAPDPETFHPDPKTGTQQTGNRKIQLITTSWSSNLRKGFDIYHYLDEHLDFNRYSMTFIGNVDHPFTNIKTIPPLPSTKLAEILREHDIFIAASHVESCSNSFLEAMHCGLPAVARNNSSHPELLNGNGLLFEDTEDILQAIDRLADGLDRYSQTMKVVPLAEVTDKYYQFCAFIRDRVLNGTYIPKRLSALRYSIARLQLKNM